MTTRKLETATIDRLVEQYAVAAAAHGEATESGDYRTGNRNFDRLAAIYKELRRRGPDAQRALLRLLDRPEPGIRGWVGAHALEFAAVEGERVLQALARDGGPLVGFSAEMTLKEWRGGRLRFP